VSRRIHAPVWSTHGKEEKSKVLVHDGDFGGTNDNCSGLARFHFTDTVRAFADVYPQRCVKEAKLTATIVEVTGQVVTSQDDARSFGRLPRKPKRGFDAKLLGNAKIDLKQNRFLSFELVAFGKNRGGGARSFSEDPIKMGVILELAKDGPAQTLIKCSSSNALSLTV
jgi:hypothetical protein